TAVDALPLHDALPGYERGEVVGTHIEERSAAWLVVEIRVRVPALVPAQHEHRSAGNRPSDGSLIDQFPGSLHPGPEEGIWSGARSEEHTSELQSRENL